MYSAFKTIEEMNKGFKALDEYIPAPLASQEATMSMLEADGAIDGKTKILMCLSVIAFVRCPECLALHLAKAFEAGLSRQEILEACAMGITFHGGPSMGFLTTHVAPAIEEFEQAMARGEEIPQVEKFKK